jgi:assimilatory nitrate reductase catalytic subunit
LWNLAARVGKIVFEDGKFFHADGRAKFMFEAPRAMPESTDKDYPLVLLTGRGSASQWHTQTRTRNSAVLRQLYPQNIYVEINPSDAKAHGIAANAVVAIESRRGAIKANAFLTNSVQPGQIFIPMHYEATNKLTHASFDPYSKQPNYKWCAVRIYSAGNTVSMKGKNQ